jgi:hypothetical protein
MAITVAGRRDKAMKGLKRLWRRCAQVTKASSKNHGFDTRDGQHPILSKLADMPIEHR